jgi:hypothetical protein
VDLSEMDWWTSIIAAYAAVVATGAFALEVRRWFESGPRLSIHIMPKAQMYNLPGADDRTWLFATATNRGNAATTITHFGLRHYRSWFDRIRSKPAWRGVVVHPHPAAHVSNVPKTIQPGEIWQGGVLHDELKNPIDEGLLYVEIYASHSDKPALKRVRVPAEPPADAEQV